MNMQTSTTVTMGGISYVANYPNIGQKMEIEQRKIIFSNGMYGSLTFSSSLAANRMLNIIDAYAYLSVCCPELGKGMTVEAFQQLSEQSGVALYEAYSKDFRKWYDEIEKNLWKVDDVLAKEAIKNAAE